MYRFLLTPRWWGINVFVVLAIPVCLFMGSWQLTRFEARVDSHEQQERSASEAAGAKSAPLASLLPVTQETSGRAARATGRYDTAHPLLVPGRKLDGERGTYVLNLLRTDSGKALPVVRGWLPGSPDPDRVPAPPRGEVTVTGALQSSESQSSAGVETGALPDGQLGIISDATLVNLVPYDVHGAWITVQRTEPPLRPVPPVAPANTGLDMKAFQNLGYTAEWFVFAGFVLFMWFRLFRREAELAKDAALGLSPQEPSSEAPEQAPEQEPGPEPEGQPEHPGAGTRTRSPSGAA